MTAFETICAVLLTGVAVSYGWGMRGTVIGGEKGAMLPGALLGLCLAKMSRIPIIEDNALFFCAVGCLGMGYGGFETYAQTMEMVIGHESDIFCPKRGYAGLMLKGGNWFGICAALLGMAVTIATGEVYKMSTVILICLAIPFIQILGIRIFNKPFDKQNGTFPKIYFSRNRFEEWGGNLLTLIFLLLVSAAHGDMFAFFFALVGILSGAVGWTVAIWLYDITVHPLKNGKYIFSKAQTNGFIDNWKLMELTLGFFGGVGCAVYFFLRLDYVKAAAEKIAAHSSIWNPLGNAEKATAWAFFLLVLLCSVQYIFKSLQTKRFFELTERAVYFSLMLAVVLLGSKTGAEIVSFLMILWVVVEKNAFDRLEKSKSQTAIKIVCLGIFAFCFACEIILKDSFPLHLTLLMYTLFYTLSDLIFNIIKTPSPNEKTLFDKLKGRILTYIWFAVLSALTFFIL